MNFMPTINSLILFIVYSVIFIFERHGIESQNYRKSYFRRLKDSSYYVKIHSDQDHIEQRINQDVYTLQDMIVQTSDFGDLRQMRPWLKTDQESIRNKALIEKQTLHTSIEYLSPKIKFGNQSFITLEKNSLSDNGCGVHSSKYIVGGKEAPEGSHPWIASLIVNGRPWCGSTIINKFWLITAAHAFEPIGTGANGITVGVGNNDRTKGTIYKVNKIIIHERYDASSFKESDIALLRVDTPIQFNKDVRPICLPEISYQNVKSNTLIAAGWGYTQYGYPSIPINLKQVKLNVIPIEKCAQIYRDVNYKIFKSQICTHNIGEDACQGDSGGPLVENIKGKGTLVGIVSYGVTCADKYPGVFTKVSYFLNWIQNNMIKNAPR